jgi:hypothetical protein
VTRGTYGRREKSVQGFHVKARRKETTRTLGRRHIDRRMGSEWIGGGIQLAQDRDTA